MPEKTYKMLRKLGAAGAMAVVMVLAIITGIAQWQRSQLMQLGQSQVQIAELIRRSEVGDAVAAMFTSSSHGWAIVREDGHIIGWNTAMQKLTGYSIDEINRVGLSILMLPQDRKGHDAAWASSMRAGAPRGRVVISKCRMVKKDTRVATVHIVVRTVQGSDGTRYVIANMDDERNVVEASEADLLRGK